MATLKEFEDALRAEGMNLALAILEKLRERDRANRRMRPARRVVGKKMTPELAQAILDMHAATEMTQQEIAFKLGVNQGRVNEVIKRGKWLSGDPNSEEAQARDKAMAKMERQRETRRAAPHPVRAAASPAADRPVEPSAAEPAPADAASTQSTSARAVAAVGASPRARSGSPRPASPRAASARAASPDKKPARPRKEPAQLAFGDLLSRG